MKRAFIVAVSVLLSVGIVACTSGTGNSVITINITDGNLKEQPVLYLPDEEQIAVELSGEGTGVVTVNNIESIYVRLGYRYTSRLIWLLSGSQINISFASGKFHESIAVDGTNGDINTFLNSNVYKYATIDECRLGEKEYITLSDSLLEANLALLENQKFPTEFKHKESLRLKYYTYQILPSFRYFHSRIAKVADYVESPEYWSKLKELCTYDCNLLSIEEYRGFLYESVSLLSKKEFPNYSGIDRLVFFIEKEIPDNKIAEYLIHKHVCSFVKKNGVEGAEKYFAAFDKYVTDPGMIEQMTQLKEKMGKCAVGAPSPDFNSTDVDGKQYTLADFAGKYVYIDVWATWCGPCRKEVPYLAELEHKFNGEGIYFVGLSCDNSREAWEKAVRAGEVKGIQLYLEPGNTFMDDYSITGIPRFILLDKEGKILSAKATAPSDPKTEETIANLLAK
ncbi:MAG: TlpA family protein disulfide reductase [Bacteroidales bacterium]|nr:TlpA family protein disulfide reductase [Bacteroidales bacterium]